MSDHPTEPLSYEEALIHQTHGALTDLHQLHERLIELYSRHEPCDLRVITLTGAAPIKAMDRAAGLSIGVINPTGFTLRLGIGGASATAAARAMPVPPSAAIVLPVATVETVEIGLDDPAAVGGATVVAWVMLFSHVQPFYLHRYG